jgi:hypothetical protein
VQNYVSSLPIKLFLANEVGVVTMGNVELQTLHNLRDSVC